MIFLPLISLTTSVAVTASADILIAERELVALEFYGVVQVQFLHHFLQVAAQLCRSDGGLVPEFDILGHRRRRAMVDVAREDCQVFFNFADVTTVKSFKRY